MQDTSNNRNKNSVYAFEQKYRANQEMYNYTNKVYTLHVPGETLIENKYKSYALADDKVFNGSVSP